MFDLSGKTALVTGASGGIGGAIARCLHAAGATVLCAGTRAAALDQLVSELGGRALAATADLRDPGAGDALVKRAEAELGKLDILVNNAGFTRDGLALRMKDEDWSEVIAINLTAAFRLARASLKGMMKRRCGRIIAITSVVGVSGNPGQANYCAAKAGLIGLTKAIAKENGTSGVTCNAICPGLGWTDVLVATGPDSAREMGITFEQMVDQFAQETALKRISTVEEVAAVAVLLASDVAAGITGSAYNVDGGTAAY